MIPAVSDSKAFGYSLSGGLDIDSNGYADLTIGDLSGSHVTTFRSSPLVTVMMEFRELRTLLDIGGDTDRLCPQTVEGDLNLLCFNVTPCFYHESNEVNEFGECARNVGFTLIPVCLILLSLFCLSFFFFYPPPPPLSLSLLSLILSLSLSLPSFYFFSACTSIHKSPKLYPTL